MIDRLLARLELGRHRYGELALAGDRRDWRRELGEELLDAVIYDTVETLRAEDQAHAELEATAARELAELAEWQERDHKTRVSDAPARLALEDLVDHGEPYDLLHVRGEKP